MNAQDHSFSDLFDQLGLPSDETGMQQFIKAHSPLAAEIALSAAPFWTPAQAAFLREECLKDADWAVVVDQLNTALRSPRP